MEEVKDSEDLVPPSGGNILEDRLIELLFKVDCHSYYFLRSIFTQEDFLLS